MHYTDIIKYPILTEKTYGSMPNGVYTFAVDKKAHKIEIKNAIEFIFQVKVSDIRTSNVDRKPKKVGRFAGFVPAYKKAIVQLAEGDTINFFPSDEAPSEEKAPKKEKVAKLTDKKEASDVAKRVAAKLARKKALKKDSAAPQKASEEKASKDEKKEK